MESIRYKAIPRNIKIKLSKLVYEKMKKKYSDRQAFNIWKIRIEEQIIKLQKRDKINKILEFNESSFRSIFDTIYKDLKLMERKGEKNKYVYFLI